MNLTDVQKYQLKEEGYLVLENFMSDELLDALRTRIEQLFREEGDRAGAEFKQEPGSRRLANLVNKGEIFREVIALSLILDCVKAVLGPNFKLSSLNVRSANPHNEITQPLHADMAALPDEHGYWVCNTVWMLDDFTTQNGAIRVIPGSHTRRQLPQDVLDDPKAPHPQQILVLGQAGSVVVMNAHLWHGGLPNRTNKPRTALHAFYARGDKPQQQYQKKLLSPQLQANLSPQLRQLLALDDPHNDRLSTDVAVRSGFLK